MDERYKKYFSDEETDKLLDLIYQFQLKFQLNRKNHSSLWKEIAEELRKQMIYKTPIQCKNRLENLKRKYNQMQRKKSKGVDLTMANWRYLMKIEELIKSKSLCDMSEWMTDAEKSK
jgi:Myb/SANT-like DNA-binding domain